MMELAALSGAAVTAASPYFAKMLDGATEKIGEDAVEAAGKIVGWLRAKFGPGGNEALDDLTKKPGDARRQEMLKLQIEKLLDDHGELAAELQCLVQTAPPPAKNQTLIISGDNAKAVQNDGTNNTISIS